MARHKIENSFSDETLSSTLLHTAPTLSGSYGVTFNSYASKIGFCQFSSWDLKHTSINEEKAPQTCESHVPNKGGGDTAGYLATPGGLGVPTLQAPGGSGVPGCSCPNIVTGLRLLATDCLLRPTKLTSINRNVLLSDSGNELTPGWRGWKYLSQERGRETGGRCQSSVSFLFLVSKVCTQQCIAIMDESWLLYECWPFGVKIELLCCWCCE